MAARKNVARSKLLTEKKPTAKTDDEVAYEEYVRLLALAIENH